MKSIKIEGLVSLGEFEAKGFDKGYLLGDLKEKEFDWNVKDDPFSLDEAPKSKESEVEFKINPFPEEYFESMLPFKNIISRVESSTRWNDFKNISECFMDLDEDSIIVSESDVYALDKKRMVKHGVYEILYKIKKVIDKKEVIVNKDLFEIVDLLYIKKISLIVEIDASNFFKREFSILSNYIRFDSKDESLYNIPVVEFLKSSDIGLDNEIQLKDSLKNQFFRKNGFFKNYSFNSNFQQLMEIYNEREKQKILDEIKTNEELVNVKRKRI